MSGGSESGGSESEASDSEGSEPLVPGEHRAPSGPEAAGVLHVVATPIGNLDDISRRALDVLSSVATIAAEDTRRTRALLTALDLPRPKMVALHDHNEAEVSGHIVAQLKAGQDTALVSDAGTPLLSDPGYALVRRCFEAGIRVSPVPGPSSIIAALSVCPLPTSDWCFAGFLPARQAARRTRLEALLSAGRPAVFFEAPHRLRDCLQDLAGLAPSRRTFIAREMTKRFETLRVAIAADQIAAMDAEGQWRGEVVCVLEGAESLAADSVEQERVLQILAAELAPAQAARLGAQLLGVRKSELYARLQAHKDG